MADKGFKEANEHYRKNYFNDEIAERIKQNVHQEISRLDQTGKVVSLYPLDKKQKPHRTLGKQIAYGCAACLVLFGLFLGSAFVSSAMAEVAASIPFLNKIFQSKPIYEVLHETLEDAGYKVSGIGYQVEGKKYFISIEGSEDYFNKVKDEVEQVTEKTISARGHDDFTIVIEREQSQAAPVANDPREQKMEFVLGVVEEQINSLKERNFSIDSFGSGYPAPESEEIVIDLTVPDTETRTAEIEAAIKEGLQANNITHYKITFYKVNLEEREIEGKWTSKILPVIWEGLAGKTEYKATGFSYSFKDGKFTITIKTSVSGSDGEAAGLAAKIKTAVNDFLKSDDLKPIVGQQPYELKVTDKKGKQIN